MQRELTSRRRWACRTCILSALLVLISAGHLSAYDTVYVNNGSSLPDLELSSVPEIYVTVGGEFVVFDTRPTPLSEMGPPVLVSTRPAIVARRLNPASVHPRYRELDGAQLLMFDAESHPVRVRTDGLYLISYVVPHWGRLAAGDAMRGDRPNYSRDAAFTIAEEIWRSGEVYGFFLAGRLVNAADATTTWAIRTESPPDWFTSAPEALSLEVETQLESALAHLGLFDLAQQVYSDLSGNPDDLGSWVDEIDRSYSALSNSSGRVFYFQRFSMGDRKRELFCKTLMWSYAADGTLELVTILDEFVPPRRAPDFNGNGIPDFVTTDFYLSRRIILDGTYYRLIPVPNFTSPSGS